jgi:hypothetical protein
MNRALAFDISDHLRHHELGRNRNHHIHMIWPQMPFFNFTLHLRGEPSEHFPQMPSQLVVQDLPAFRDENKMIFALPLVWFRLLLSSIAALVSVCSAAHGVDFPRLTSESVKLFLPPRQSRRDSERL